MAIYTDKWPTVYAQNTVTELELTTSQNIADNYTRVNYVVRVRKINNWNDNWTPASGGSYLTLTIGGVSVRSNYRSTWSTYSNTEESTTAIVDSGHVNVYHNADGTKTIDYTMTLNPNVAALSGMPNRVISGSFVATTIPRASSFTVNSSLTTGSNYTVSITRASTSFTHRVYRKIGSSEVELTTSAVGTSHTINMPHSLFNSYPNSESISASIIVATFNGTTQVGSISQNVTINLVSTAIPTNTTTTVSNSDNTPFVSTNQMIRGISRLTLGTGTVGGSYSSTISSYEFSYQQVGGDWMPTVSSSTGEYTYPAFNFPNSGSVALNVRSRVRDSRGRYSAWIVGSSVARVHYYAPPSIGSISLRRAGSGNTTLQVYRSHSVTPLYEGGSTSNQKNTANLRFQTRELGGTTISDNTGGGSTSLSTSAAWVNLSGAFNAGKSYQVRAVLSDGRQTVYGSWVSVGTEFVPLDVGPKGIGVGKVHSDGSADLEVGSGGINSGGPISAGSGGISSGGPISVGGKTVYHQGNLSLKSIDAVKLNGKSATTIISEAISGATPTYGTGSNGKYWRTGNLQICTGKVTLSSGGNGYYYAGTWTFPASFYSASEIYCSANVSTVPTSGNYTNWNGNATMHSPTTTGVSMWWGGTHDTKTLVGTVTLDVIAIGRWKA